METRKSKLEIGSWQCAYTVGIRLETRQAIADAWGRKFVRFHQFLVSILEFRFSSFDFPASNFDFLFSSFHSPVPSAWRGLAAQRQHSARRSPHQIWRGSQFVNQAQRQGLASRNAFRGQQELRRRRPAD